MRRLPPSFVRLKLKKLPTKMGSSTWLGNVLNFCVLLHLFVQIASGVHEPLENTTSDMKSVGAAETESSLYGPSMTPLTDSAEPSTSISTATALGHLPDLRHDSNVAAFSSHTGCLKSSLNDSIYASKLFRREKFRNSTVKRLSTHDSSHSKIHEPFEKFKRTLKRNESESFNNMLLRMAGVALLNRSQISLLTGEKSHNDTRLNLERLLSFVDPDSNRVSEIGKHSVGLPQLLDTLFTDQLRQKISSHPDKLRNKKSRVNVDTSELFGSKSSNSQMHSIRINNLNNDLVNKTTANLSEGSEGEIYDHLLSKEGCVKFRASFGANIEKLAPGKLERDEDLEYKSVCNSTDTYDFQRIPTSIVPFFEDNDSDLNKNEFFKQELLEDFISGDDSKLDGSVKLPWIEVESNASIELENETETIFTGHPDDLETSDSELRATYQAPSNSEKVYHPQQATLPRLYNPLNSYKLARNHLNEPIIVPRQNNSSLNLDFLYRKNSVRAKPSVTDSRGTNFLHESRAMVHSNIDSVFQEPKYHFSYEIDDTSSGNFFRHQEDRDGSNTSGQYSVLLPDGRTQIVSYVADADGYRADVRYEHASEEKRGDLYSTAAGKVKENTQKFSYVDYSRKMKMKNEAKNSNQRPKNPSAQGIHPFQENAQKFPDEQNLRKMKVTITPKRYNQRPKHLNLQNFYHLKNDANKIREDPSPLASMNRKKVLETSITTPPSLLSIQQQASPSRLNSPVPQAPLNIKSVVEIATKLEQRTKFGSEESVFSVDEEAPPLIFHPTILAVGGTEFWQNYLRSWQPKTSKEIAKSRKNLLNIGRRQQLRLKSDIYPDNTGTKRTFSRADFFIPASRERVISKRNPENNSSVKKHMTEVSFTGRESNEKLTNFTITPENEQEVHAKTPLSLFIKRF